MHNNTNLQRSSGGLSGTVSVPYDEFLSIYKKNRHLIPHEVVGAVVDGMTPVGAWRGHLNVPREEMAVRLDLSQPAYLKLEKSEQLTDATRQKMASALGIVADQLNF